MDVVARESASRFELRAVKDQTLLIMWDALLVINLELGVFNRARQLDVDGDRLAPECFIDLLNTFGQITKKVKNK